MSAEAVHRRRTAHLGETLTANERREALRCQPRTGRPARGRPARGQPVAGQPVQPTPSGEADLRGANPARPTVRGQPARGRPGTHNLRGANTVLPTCAPAKPRPTCAGANLRGANLYGANLSQGRPAPRPTWHQPARGQPVPEADLRGPTARGRPAPTCINLSRNLYRGPTCARPTCAGRPSHTHCCPMTRQAAHPSSHLHDHWHLRIGCWTGTTDDLRTPIAGDDWPEAEGAEQDKETRPAAIADPWTPTSRITDSNPLGLPDPEAGDPMRLYIAGPMTGLPDSNYPAFFRAADQFASAGHDPINPARPWKAADAGHGLDYMRACCATWLTVTARTSRLGQLAQGAARTRHCARS